MLRNNKAQAILELAILGALLISAFSIAISYSEKYNRQQSYLQQCFRATLKAARNAKTATSYGTTDFRRMSNVTNPLELGSLQQFASSNNVLWNDGKEKGPDGEPPKPKAFYEFDGAGPQELPVSEEIPSGVHTYSSSFSTNATNYTDTTNWTTQNANKNQNSYDTVSASVDFADGTAGASHDLGYGGKYTGGGIHR